MSDTENRRRKRFELIVTIGGYLVALERELAGIADIALCQEWVRQARVFQDELQKLEAGVENGG